jgi:hypothetical protein
MTRAVAGIAALVVALAAAAPGAGARSHVGHHSNSKKTVAKRRPAHRTKKKASVRKPPTKRPVKKRRVARKPTPPRALAPGLPALAAPVPLAGPPAVLADTPVAGVATGPPPAGLATPTRDALSGAPPAPAPSATPPVSLPHGTTVTASDRGDGLFAFMLTSRTVAAGLLHLTLYNADASEHDLSVRFADGNTVSLVHVDGGSGTVRQTDATLPAGTYVLFCALPGHEAAGMHATLKVI